MIDEKAVHAEMEKLPRDVRDFAISRIRDHLSPILNLEGREKVEAVENMLHSLKKIGL